MSVLKALLRSKKFVTTLAGVAVWVAGRFGFHVDASDLYPVVGALSVYVVGQGVADFGKEAIVKGKPEDTA